MVEPRHLDTEFSDQTILITGGAGFIGGHIAKALAPMNEVRILDDLSTGSRENVPSSADLTVGSITDESILETLMENVDHVFHEAAIVSVPQSIERPVLTNEINLDGTLLVLEQARHHGARLIFASSAAVYGQPQSMPIKEDQQTVPLSPYGLTKLVSDEYLRLYCTNYGVETVSLRYFNVYGPGQQGGQYSGVIETFIDQAVSGRPITVHGDGRQTRDFVHVRDIVRANVLAAKTDAVGRTYNIGTGESVTIVELADIIRRMANSDSSIQHIDPRPGDIRESRPDISSAVETFGFNPQVSLEEGLRTLPGLGAQPKQS